MAHNTTYQMLDKAVGSIQASSRQQERLDEVTTRLLGDEFYVTVASAIPSACIDGRIGTHEPSPNAAGGSETIMVADDLTFHRLSRLNQPTGVGYRKTLEHLLSQALPVGGHTDEHADDRKSGCGANDRLPEIYRFIAEHGDELQELADSLGIKISDLAKKRIIKNAESRQDFSTGAELLGILGETAGNEAVDPLVGEHKEVVAVVNMVRGTTLDRYALAQEFGPDYESFNIDAWSFSDAAEAIAESESEVSELVAAMTFYNLATAHVLCGPKMRVIVRANG